MTKLRALVRLQTDFQQITLLSSDVLISSRQLILIGELAKEPNLNGKRI